MPSSFVGRLELVLEAFLRALRKAISSTRPNFEFPLRARILDRQLFWQHRCTLCAFLISEIFPLPTNGLYALP